MRTDDPGYYENIIGVFEADRNFQPIETSPELASLLTDFELHFQARGVKTRRMAYEAV